MKTLPYKFGGCLLALMGWAQTAANDSVVTSVYSSVSNGYARATLADGSWKPESYVMGNGGFVAGTVANSAGEDVTFPTIVRLVAAHLAKKNYLPAPEAKSADLLLVLSWGKTNPFNDAAQRTNTDGVSTAVNNLNIANDTVRQNEAQGDAQRSPDGIQSPARSVRDAARDSLEGQLFQMQLFNGIRSRANERNANLLGYTREINEQNNVSRFAGNGTYYDDLISDIENERYYVIISAYDYPLAVQEKKRKILWTTRVSIQAQGNSFKEGLAVMLANASRQFGQNSGRLVRQYQQGTVNLGELKFLETLPDSAVPAKPPGEK